jgi:hypothetical protein
MSGAGLYIELGIQGPPPLQGLKGRPIGNNSEISIEAL